MHTHLHTHIEPLKFEVVVLVRPSLGAYLVVPTYVIRMFNVRHFTIAPVRERLKTKNTAEFRGATLSYCDDGYAKRSDCTIHAHGSRISGSAPSLGPNFNNLHIVWHVCFMCVCMCLQSSTVFYILTVGWLNRCGCVAFSANL